MEEGSKLYPDVRTKVISVVNKRLL